jgi:hypothetical protein
MKEGGFFRSIVHTVFAGPIIMFRMGEMTVASAQVIAFRLARWTNSDGRHSAEDKREFKLMGQEKIDGGIEAAGAMIGYSREFFGRFLRGGMLGSKGGARAPNSPSKAWAPKGGCPPPVQLIIEIVLFQLVFPLRTYQFFSNLIMHASNPLHRRVMQNAKRLSKGKK